MSTTTEVKSEYTFPTCLHVLSAALSIENISPSSVTISLPFDAWWRLYGVLDRKFHGLVTPSFDGRDKNPVEFRYLGFKFVVELK